MTRTDGTEDRYVTDRFTTPLPVRSSDIDMPHVNHASMVAILEARVPFLAEPFADDFATIGC